LLRRVEPSRRAVLARRGGRAGRHGAQGRACGGGRQRHERGGQADRVARVRGRQPAAHRPAIARPRRRRPCRGGRALAACRAARIRPRPRPRRRGRGVLQRARLACAHHRARPGSAPREAASRRAPGRAHRKLSAGHTGVARRRTVTPAGSIRKGDSMATRKLCFALVMSAALAACGSPDAPAGADGASSPSGAAAQPERSKAAAQPDRSRVAATAAEVAAEARGNVKCPAKVSTAPRPGLGAHDVVGVRPGMTWDEAVNVVLCTHELLVVTENRSRRFEVNTWGQAVRQGFDAVFAEDRINKTSQEILAEMQDSAMARGTNRRSPGMPGGTARWYVTTMGVPGDERVVAATRLEAYAEDKAPTMAGVRDALVEKYGAPTSVFEGGVWELR